MASPFEAKHDRMRHQANEFAQAQQPCQNLNEARQNDRSKNVFHAVGFSQSNNYHGHRASSPGDHTRTTTQDGGNQANGKGGIKSRQGRKPCDQRKSDRFGNEGECNGETGKHLSPVINFLFKIEKIQVLFHVTGI